VLKAAKNMKGYSQNEVEYNISLDETTDIFAKIINFSNDYKYIVMEKADKLRNFTPVLDYYNIRNKRQFNRVKEIQYIISKYQLTLPDLSNITSWGIINGVPRLLIMGLQVKYLGNTISKNDYHMQLYLCFLE
jgi:hypothetical protein